MKTLAIFLLFETLICDAQDTSDLTRKVIERDRDKDGKPDFRVESVFRGGKRVMVVWSKPNTQGVWAVTMRAYYANGDMIFVESDEDREGLFEKLVVYRSGTKDIEVFTRHHDGSVQPVSAQTLRAYKKQFAAFDDLAEGIFDKDMDSEKLIRGTQKKLRDAEKEKDDEKK